MNRRLVPVFIALLASVTVGGWMIGSPVIALAGMLVLVFFLVGVAVARRRVPAEPTWAKATTPFEPRVVVQQRGTPHEISRALGAVESRELLYSPWFAVGVGLLIVLFVGYAAAAGWDLDNGPVWMQNVHLAPWFAHPLAGMTIIAVFRAVTRSKRDDTDELFDGCPTGRDIRTTGHLRTMIVPLAAFAIFAGAYVIAIVVRASDLHGPVNWTMVAIIGAAFVLLVGAVVLGTALATWLPYALVPIVAVFAIGFSSLSLRTSGDPGWNELASLSTVGPEGSDPLLIPLTSPWAYLAWIAALTVVVGAIAVARYSQGTGVVIAGFGGVGVALVAGAFAVQPVSAEGSAEVAELIMHPEDHQTCTTTPNQAISVCTFHDYPELRHRVTDDLLLVADEMKGLAGPVTVRQTYDRSIGDLPDRVRRVVGDRLPAVPGNEVWIGHDASPDGLNADRLGVALWTLDAPYTRRSNTQPEVIAGQARGVIALWMAARGLDLDDALDLASVDTEWETPKDAYDRGYAWPSGCAPVIWAAQDLEAARAVMAVPEQAVRSVLHDDPQRWKDPATSTDELMDALGLEPVGPFESVEARPEDYC